MQIIYVFDCPVHGEESQVFCFRAADPKLTGRWKRYRITRTEIPVFPPEIIEIQARLSGPRKGI